MGRSARVAPTPSALAVARGQFALGMLAALAAWTVHAGDEPPVPAGKTPARIEKPAHPFVAPSGPSRAACELYLKNDIPSAERAFLEVLAKAPRDLEALECLRVCLLADGRFAGVQEVNLRMIAAAGRGRPRAHPMSLSVADINHRDTAVYAQGKWLFIRTVGHLCCIGDSNVPSESRPKGISAGPVK